MDYLYCLQNLREGCLSFLSPVLYCISEVGLLLGLILPLIFFWSIDKKLGRKLLFAYGISQVVTNFTKLCACISRPWIRDSRLHVYEKAKGSATGYSFPSGHSTTAGCTFGGLAYEKRNNKVICIICAFVTIAIPFARNWLGAHTIYDVITGLIIGFASFLAVSALIEKVEENVKYEIIFIAASVVLVAAAMIFVRIKNYPQVVDSNGALLVDPVKMQLDFYKMCGAYFGLLTGLILERKFVGYEIPQKTIPKVLIGAIGTATTLVLFIFVIPFIVSPLFTELGKFLKYFLSGIYACAGYPALVKKFLSLKK